MDENLIKEAADKLKSEAQNVAKSTATEIVDEKLKVVTDQLEVMKSNFETELKAQAEKIQKSEVKMIEKSVEQESDDVLILKSIESRLPDFELFKKGHTKSFNFDVEKSTLTITSGYSGDKAPITGVSNMWAVKPTPQNLIEILPKGRAEKGTVTTAPYMYYNPAGIEMLAEGVASQEIIATMEVKTFDLKEISANLPVSNRVFTSLPEAAAGISYQLPKQMNKKTNSQILYGSGVSAEVKGLFTIARSLGLGSKSFSAGFVSSIASYNGGTQVVINTTTDHGLGSGQLLTIANSTNYNAEYSVIVTGDRQLLITATYVSETVSAWTATSKSLFYHEIENANILDAIRAAVVQIRAAEDNTEIDTVLMSAVDYGKAMMQKDTTGQPLQNTIAELGVNIVVVNGMKKNDILFTKWDIDTLSIRPYGDNQVDKYKLVSTDTENVSKRKATAYLDRAFFLVVSNEYNFVKSSISSIITDINAA